MSRRCHATPPVFAVLTNVTWEQRWEHGTRISGTPDTPDPLNHADSTEPGGFLKAHTGFGYSC